LAYIVVFPFFTLTLFLVQDDLANKIQTPTKSLARARAVQTYTKFANFARLYFPSFTTFSSQILQFYYFHHVLFSCGV
jgi:hypothetical protein